MSICFVATFFTVAICAVFFASAFCASGFVRNHLAPKSIDAERPTNWREAIIVDPLLPGAGACPRCRDSSSAAAGQDRHAEARYTIR
jgi:hypothetical protein